MVDAADLPEALRVQLAALDQARARSDRVKRSARRGTPSCRPATEITRLRSHTMRASPPGVEATACTATRLRGW